MPLADYLVNVGTVAYDGTGDRGQVPFTKYNNAITELYGMDANLAALIAIGSTFTFDQITAASVWIIAHNLGRFPAVTVVDSSGAEVEGDVRYVDANNLTVTFSAGFAGVAYLN